MLALLASLAGVGCGDDDGDMMDADGGMEPDMMTTTDAGRDMGQPDLGGDGDGNDSFAEAQAVDLGVPVEGAAIGTAGDRDYYSFTGEEGQWLVISTSANPDDDTDMVDTVITLYDGTMTQIAENDDSIPRANTDSEIITRLPAAGTYYVEVLEFSDWAGETPEGMPSFTYDLTIAELDPAAAAVNIDAEGGDDVASAQALSYATNTGGDFALLVGELRDASDVDVFTFSVTAARPFPEFVTLPAGTDGMGSTSLPTAVWVTDVDGTEIIGRVDPSVLTDLSPALAPGDYQLWIEHGGTAGSNDFYVLKGFRYTADNPPEANDALNDDIATPDPITLADADADGISTGFILAQIPDGDTDHFSFDVEAGDVVSVFCGSRTAGSGVIDLQAQLSDPTGATVYGTATETATDGIAITEADVGGAAGTVVLQLTKGSQDAEVTGTWVRCGVAVGPAGV